jgi:dedicator of cytokinesis protein 3
MQRLHGDTASERHPSSPSQYQPSVSGFSLKRSMSSTSTTRPPFTVPPILLSRSVAVEPALLSPKSASFVTTDTVKQTPLQRHLAHLTRHGITGVSSSPGDMNNGTESISAESPRGSIVNVNGGAGVPPAAGYSGASVASITNTVRSGSIKGRISRFGSFNFGRRAGAT